MLTLKEEEAALILDRAMVGAHGLFVVIDSVARDMEDLGLLSQHFVKVVFSGDHALELDCFAGLTYCFLDGLLLLEEIQLA